jgi:hypothetical protein
MKQMSLTLEQGIGSRNRSLREHLATRIYAAGLVGVAGKLDLSGSKLSEKLAGTDSGGKPRGMTVDELERYITVTGDVSPIHYLVDKFLQDPGVVQAEALAKLAMLAEQLPGLMAAAGLATQARAGRR